MSDGTQVGVIVEKVDEGLNLALPLEVVLPGWRAVQNGLLGSVQKQVARLPPSSLEFATFVVKSADEEQRTGGVSDATFSRLESAIQTWTRQADGETWALAQSILGCRYFNQAMNLLSHDHLKLFQGGLGPWESNMDQMGYQKALADADQANSNAQDWYNEPDHRGLIYDNTAGAIVRLVALIDSASSTNSDSASEYNGPTWSDEDLSNVLSGLGSDPDRIANVMGQPDSSWVDVRTGARNYRYISRNTTFPDSLAIFATTNPATGQVIQIYFPCFQLKSQEYSCLGDYDPFISINSNEVRLGQPQSATKRIRMGGGYTLLVNLNSGDVLGIITDASGKSKAVRSVVKMQ